MSKIHIGKNGPSPCHAQKSKCPLGGESGSENHYDSMEEATQAYEKKLSDDFGSVKTLSKAKGGGQSKSELAQLAKNTDDVDIMMKIVNEGGARAINNLTKNPNAIGEVLMKAEEGDPSLRSLTSSHPNYPLDSLNMDEFKRNISGRGDYASRSKDNFSAKKAIANYLESDALADDHLNIISRSLASPKNAKELYENAARNVNNNLSEEGVRSALIMATPPAVYTGPGKTQERVFPAEEMIKENHPRFNMENFKNLSSDEMTAMQALSFNDKEKFLSAVTDATVAKISNSSEADHGDRQLLEKVLDKPELDKDSLRKISEIDFNKFGDYRDGVARKVNHHPNADESIKNNIAKYSPTIQLENKLRATDGSATIDEYKSKIIKSSTGGGNPRRGYHVSDLELDSDKLKRDGVGEDELRTIFAGRYNGEFRYDASSGRLHMTLDSGD